MEMLEILRSTIRPLLMKREQTSQAPENASQDLLKASEMPQKVKDALFLHGANLEEIWGFKWLNEERSAMGFYDKNGLGVGFLADGKIETYSRREKDLRAIEKDEKAKKNNLLAEDGLSDCWEEEENISKQKPLIGVKMLLQAADLEKISKHPVRISYGCDECSCIGTYGLAEYEIKAVAAHPETLLDKEWKKIIGEDGHTYAFKDKFAFDEDEYEYEPEPEETADDSKDCDYDDD